MTIARKQNLNELRECSRESKTLTGSLTPYFIHHNQRRRHKEVTRNPLVMHQGGGREQSRGISEIGPKVEWRDATFFHIGRCTVVDNEHLQHRDGVCVQGERDHNEGLL